MKPSDIEITRRIANTVRALSIDAIEKQQSGHPGMALGFADVGAFLFAHVLRYNPRNPAWMGRDRFLLSAGHGSMMQYALLHLSGYDLSLEDLKRFRELHSRTPGHPEVGETAGIEVSTGPLGQGVAAGVGMAIAQKICAARFGAGLFDYKIWVVAGDGCMMEGICSEASSLAGTLGLDNFILIYDSNDISLDGPTSEVFVEDVLRRYEAYGFRVMQINGYDYSQFESAFAAARMERGKPVLIMVKTVIGWGSPGKEGTAAAHGGPLGMREIEAVKQKIGWPEEPFFVPDDVYAFFRERLPNLEREEAAWNEKLLAFRTADTDKSGLWDQCINRQLPDDFDTRIRQITLAPDQATRKYSEIALNEIGRMLPFLLSCSADLSSCDFTWLKYGSIVRRDSWCHQQVKFGVREFAMAAAAYGMQLHGMVQPVIGTFLTFSDYMRNAIRMAAMMKQRVIFVFSHDSIFLGQDGPTHQPVEHLMSLRLIPGLTLIRPGDENEVKAAYIAALHLENGPVALCFTRNPIRSTVSDLTAKLAHEGVSRGAYVLYGAAVSRCDVMILATGTEIHPAVGAARLLEAEGFTVRVVSMPSWELFETQDQAYRAFVLGPETRLKVSVEAGVGLGWQKYVGPAGLILSLETYGASASQEVLADYFGFTAEKVAGRIRQALRGRISLDINLEESRERSRR